jgi:transcriptional regulator with XRE-family HTH domain
LQPDDTDDHGDDRDLLLDDAWKAHVRAWLERQGKTQAWLARKAGESPGMVSAYLQSIADRRAAGLAPIRNSRCAAAIARITGIPRPKRDASHEVALLIQAAEDMEREYPDQLHIFRVRLQRTLDAFRAGSRIMDDKPETPAQDALHDVGLPRTDTKEPQGNRKAGGPRRRARGK